MEKRVILAIVLSMLVLMVWSSLVPKPQPIANKEVTKEIAPLETKTPAPIAQPVAEKEIPSSSLFELAQEKYAIKFIEPLAAIQEVIFKNHLSYKLPLQYGFLLGDKTLVFRKESSTPASVSFVANAQDKKIVKRFTFPNPNYTIDLEVEIQNLSAAPLELDLPLYLGVLDLSAKNQQARYQDVTVATKEKTTHISGRKKLNFAEVKFLSLRDRYFCAIIQPEENNYAGFVQTAPQQSEVGLSLKRTLKPGEQFKQKFHIYLGPQDLRLMNSINPEWSQVIHYGTFDFISQILLQLLEFLYRLVHNWGWAIVLLSLIVYLVLYPLTLKQMRSMKEMQVLQPKIEELRQAHKDNPQKLNKEIMELYREHKVNPLGGCLPLLLQMPIFFALYQALMRSVVLKGASFLWIKDLSEPDRLFTLPVSLPFIGNEINILPIVMTIGMFIQQKISQVATSTSTDQQRMMMIIFPLMFGFIFYHMPSGLVLYWFINSTLMLIYQFRVSRQK